MLFKTDQSHTLFIFRTGGQGLQRRAFLGHGLEKRPRVRRTLRFLLIVLILSHPLAGLGMEPVPPPPVPESSSLFSLSIGGYQKYLSPVLDSKCYMQPSCSVYAIQALSEYGPWLGLLMTVDRLFHEANEDRTSPLVRQGKALKLYDPPKANVWWK